jgi:hypothetical protein
MSCPGPNVRASPINVRYWHKADIGSRGLNVCFGGKAGISGPGDQCLLLTQSGHAQIYSKSASPEVTAGNKMHDAAWNLWFSRCNWNDTSKDTLYGLGEWTSLGVAGVEQWAHEKSIC